PRQRPAPGGPGQRPRRTGSRPSPSPLAGERGRLTAPALPPTHPSPRPRGPSMSVPLLDDAVTLAYPVLFHLAQATGPAAAIVLATVAVRLLLFPLTLAAIRGERAHAGKTGAN